MLSSYIDDNSRLYDVNTEDSESVNVDENDPYDGTHYILQVIKPASETEKGISAYLDSETGEVLFTFETTLDSNHAIREIDEEITIDDLIGVYEGTYSARQGETGLLLTVFSSDSQIMAIFDFYDLVDSDKTSMGSFYMKVTQDDNEFTFSADSWINNPNDYDRLDLVGTLNGDYLSGTVYRLDGTSPGSFSVKRLESISG